MRLGPGRGSRKTCGECGGPLDASAEAGHVPVAVQDGQTGARWETCESCGAWRIAPSGDRPSAGESKRLPVVVGAGYDPSLTIDMPARNAVRGLPHRRRVVRWMIVGVTLSFLGVGALVLPPPLRRVLLVAAGVAVLSELSASVVRHVFGLSGRLDAWLRWGLSGVVASIATAIWGLDLVGPALIGAAIGLLTPWWTIPPHWMLRRGVDADSIRLCREAGGSDDPLEPLQEAALRLGTPSTTREALALLAGGGGRTHFRRRLAERIGEAGLPLAELTPAETVALLLAVEPGPTLNDIDDVLPGFWERLEGARLLLGDDAGGARKEA